VARTGVTTLRANLISPIDGDSFAQVVKVDLLHMKAQILQIGQDGTVSALDRPHDVAALAEELFAVFPACVPAPNIWELA